MPQASIHCEVRLRYDVLETYIILLDLIRGPLVSRCNLSKTSILTPPAPDDSGYVIYKRLALYAVKHWKYLIVAIVGLILGGLTIPLFAVYMQPLLDGTFMEKDPEIIKWAPLALLLIFLLRGVSGFMSSYSMEWIGRSVVKEIRSELFSRLLRLPVSFYDKNNSGQLVTRLIYHVEQVSIAATKGLTTLGSRHCGCDWFYCCNALLQLEVNNYYLLCWPNYCGFNCLYFEAF